MAIMESIETIYLEQDTATVTFDSIPSTYEYLEFRMSASTDYSAAGYDAVKLNFNGDTGSNYAEHGGGAYSGTSLWAHQATGQAYVNIYRCSSMKQGGYDYGCGIVTIYDYANSNKNTTLGQSVAGVIGGNYTESAIYSGLWDSTAAVTSFVLDPHNGSNFLRGSESYKYHLGGKDKLLYEMIINR